MKKQIYLFEIDRLIVDCRQYCRLTVNALMQNVGAKYGIAELEHPNVQPNFITTLVEAAIEKQENAEFEVENY
jgi:hypothetical protein